MLKCFQGSSHSIISLLESYLVLEDRIVTTNTLITVNDFPCKSSVDLYYYPQGPNKVVLCPQPGRRLAGLLFGGCLVSLSLSLLSEFQRNLRRDRLNPLGWKLSQLNSISCPFRRFALPQGSRVSPRVRGLLTYFEGSRVQGEGRK